MAITSGLSVSPDLAASRGRSAWALSLPLLAGLTIFVCLCNTNGLPMLADPDSQWHVAIGNWILQHRRFPDVDFSSYTFAGQPWIAKEWLSQVLYAVAFDIGGWGAVMSLGAAGAAITFALLLRLLLDYLRPMPALLFVVAIFTMMSVHLLARPFMLAFPLMLIWVAGLMRAAEEKRAPRPILLVAMLFWANMHGGFTFGLLMGGAFALDALVGAGDAAERRRLFIGWLKFGVAAIMVACITPYGPESILVTGRIFSLGDSLSMIAEWRSPNFQNQPLQELMVLVALYLCLSRGLKLPLVRLLIVLGLTHMFLKYVRNIELLAMLAPLVVAPVLARQFPKIAAHSGADGLLDRLGGSAGRRAVVVGLAAAAVFAAGIIRFGDVLPPDSNQPRAALDFARQEGLLKGRVLNDYGFGGFLIGAGVPTFIDGRGELFGGAFIKRFGDAVNLRGDSSLEALLEEYKVDWTLLGKDMPANKLLAHLPGWRRAYGDDQATIFVRDR